MPGSSPARVTAAAELTESVCIVNVGIGIVEGSNVSNMLTNSKAVDNNALRKQLHARLVEDILKQSLATK